MSASTAEFTEAIQHLPPGGTLVLTGVAWEDYEELLAQLAQVSRSFPFITREILSEYLNQSKTRNRVTVLRSFRAWLRSTGRQK